MVETTGTPLSGPPPEEIPLARAPLVRVLAQVQFPTLLVIKEGQNLSAFQERVRDVYPFFNKDEIKSSRIQIGPQGPNVQTEASVIWRFTDENGKWRLSLAPDFVALETKEYVSREDFLIRLLVAVRAVEETYKPKIATRIGFRYVDQLKNDAFDNASKLIKKEVMGIFGLVESDRILHGISEISLRADEGNLLVKWGQLSPDTTFDPNIIDPIKTPSWVLDLDLFSETHERFVAEHLNTIFRSFAERIYSMFRWVITPEFIKHYGDKK